MGNRYRYGKRIYRIWVNMRSRCRNPKQPVYERYGGRGISVCKEWNDFDTFAKWAIENGYNDDLTIERIDVNGNYCPKNCTWITRGEQAQNRRNTFKITYNGETKPAAHWAKDLHFSKATVKKRIKKGLSLEAAMSPEKIKPHSPIKHVKQEKNGTVIGEYKSAREAAEKIGGNERTIRYACREEKTAYGFNWKYTGEVN